MPIYFKFNFHNDCNFDLILFGTLFRYIEKSKDLDNMELINDKLKENIKTHIIKITNIEKTSNQIMVNFDVNPI